MNIKAPRGTYDIYGPELRLRNKLIQRIYEITENYGFYPIQTPMFESQELFVRAVGSDTDVVSKEMYEIIDKKDRKMVLRPEITAPIVRSFIENKMYASTEAQKFAYFGPAFRYERPQAGRFRQFHQFGVEYLNADDVSCDIEIISLAHSILKHFDIVEDTTLNINTLGDKEGRKAYTDALTTYFNNHHDELCDDCKTRLETNPLRLLDCKVCSKKEFFNGIPNIIDYVSEQSRADFERVCRNLDNLGINYVVNPNLVRGLDYYNDTVFEFVTNEARSQNAILGGGRYDNLVSDMSNKSSKCVGFAFGVERFESLIDKAHVAQILELDKHIQTDIYFAPMNVEAQDMVMKMIKELRDGGLVCEMPRAPRALKKQLQHANNIGAVLVIIIGEEEIKNNTIVLKNMISKEESILTYEEFLESIMEEGCHE